MYRMLIDNWQITVTVAVVTWLWLMFFIIEIMPADRFRGDLKYGEYPHEEESTE